MLFVQALKADLKSVLVLRETALTTVFVLVYKSQCEDLVLTTDLQVHVFFFFFFCFEDLNLYFPFFSVV